MPPLVQMLNGQSNLRKLQLHKVNMEWIEWIIMILQLIKANQNLEALEISYSNFGDTSYEILATFTSLTKLRW